jgi:hypothetical protein
MGPEKRKEEQPVSEAARNERPQAPRSAGAEEESDPREEEGWSQPEASTQKGAAVPKNLDGEAE